MKDYKDLEYRKAESVLEAIACGIAVIVLTASLLTLFILI